jgi:hypothetical protein
MAAEPTRGAGETPGIDYRRISWQLGFLAMVLAGAGGTAGYLLAGSKGAWGALLGAAVVGLFFASSGVVMHLAKTAEAQARNLLVAWFAKLIVLFGLLLALNSATFINRPAFGVTILVGIIGSLVLEGRVVWSARVPPMSGPDGGRDARGRP